MYGGEGGIRTRVELTPKVDFESTAFNHSATPPLNVDRIGSAEPL